MGGTIATMGYVGQLTDYRKHYQNETIVDWLDGMNATVAAVSGGVKMDGNKPIVVCGGEAREAKDMEAAQSLAESLAHSKSADAYILKPVRRVAPKRDVVTTEL
jgi:hypothetical protein